MSKSTITYRRHEIKTFRLSAQAFRGIHRVGEVMTGASLEEAIAAVKDFLDARAKNLQSQRGLNGHPCAEEIKDALQAVSMSEKQQAMLRAHYQAKDYILTATQLAQAAGYEDYSVANRFYGQLACDLARELDWTPSPNTKGIVTWTYTLAEDADKSERENGEDIDGQWRWKLRDEVVEALCLLSWFQQA